jgi:tetratricopeptide (TPR) repeat protein
MNIPAETILDESKLPLKPPGKSPWNPNLFIGLAFVFSFGASGILAGLNWRRLGKPASTWPTIILSQIGLIGFILALNFLPFSNLLLSRLFAYGINIGIGALLKSIQLTSYTEWVTLYGEPKRKEAGFLIPIVIGIGTAVLLLFCILFMSVFERTEISDPSIEHFKKGIKYQQQNELVLAIQEYTAAIKINSKFYDAYVLNGDACFNQGDFDRAISNSNKAIEINPNDPSNYLRRGTSYQILREFNNAIADLSQAIKLDPKSVTAYHNRSAVYSSKQEYINALADINQAIALDSVNPDLYQTRGLLYNNMNNFTKALTDLNQALQIAPDKDSVWLSRGLVYYKNNIIEKAKADFRKAIELNHDNSQIVDELIKNVK